MNDTSSVNSEMFYGIIIICILSIICIISFSKLFKKAGKPEWAIIVPIYNIIVYLEIIEKPWWLFILIFIPYINIIFIIWSLILFVRKFGDNGWLGLVLLLFPFIYLPLLAFDKDVKYLGNFTNNHSNNTEFKRKIENNLEFEDPNLIVKKIIIQKNKTPYLGLLIFLFIILFLTLPFHYVPSRMMVFPKDNLSFSYTFITEDDLMNIRNRINKASIFDQHAIINEPFIIKLREKGLIIIENNSNESIINNNQ